MNPNFLPKTFFNKKAAITCDFCNLENSKIRIN